MNEHINHFHLFQEWLKATHPNVELVPSQLRYAESHFGEYKSVSYVGMGSGKTFILNKSLLLHISKHLFYRNPFYFWVSSYLVQRLP